METVQKLKKKKHEKKLEIKRHDSFPRPLSEEEVQMVAELKNELEAAIYGARDKLEQEDILKVSTEEQREAVTKLYTDFDEWMYESSIEKNEYDKRLSELKDLLGPI